VLMVGFMFLLYFFVLVCYPIYDVDQFHKNIALEQEACCYDSR